MIKRVPWINHCNLHNATKEQCRMLWAQMTGVLAMVGISRELREAFFWRLGWLSIIGRIIWKVTENFNLPFIFYSQSLFHEVTLTFMLSLSVYKWQWVDSKAPVFLEEMQKPVYSECQVWDIHGGKWNNKLSDHWAALILFCLYIIHQEGSSIDISKLTPFSLLNQLLPTCYSSSPQTSFFFFFPYQLETENP